MRARLRVAQGTSNRETVMIKLPEKTRATPENPSQKEQKPLVQEATEEQANHTSNGKGRNGNGSVHTGSTRRKHKRPKLRWDRKKQALRLGIERTSLYRLGVQALFVLVSLALGWQFYRFVQAAKTTTEGPLPTRPPGVEGYLPISGLMGAVDWVYQGTLNTIHPAATILFLLFVLMALLVRKSFCGWVCPVGFLSEWLARGGRLLIGRNFRLWKWVDIPLRSLKYLLLGFFVWAIFAMGAAELHAFIESPYNKISDVKMLEFFLDLTWVGATVIAVLAVLSVLVHSFWCRYLCPYGALMGLVGWLSPLKVRREPEICTDCGVCDKVCPARLPVSKKQQVSSVECIGCTDCVTSCPVKGALRFGSTRRSVRPKTIAISLVALFIVGYVTANSLDMWQNDLSADEVRYHVRHMDSPEYGHPGMEKE